MSMILFLFEDWKSWLRLQSITVAPWPIADEAWIDPNMNTVCTIQESSLRPHARARQMFLLVQRLVS